jgi:hypothetical protein
MNVMCPLGYFLSGILKQVKDFIHILTYRLFKTFCIADFHFVSCRKNGASRILRNGDTFIQSRHFFLQVYDVRAKVANIGSNYIEVPVDCIEVPVGFAGLSVGEALRHLRLEHSRKDLRPRRSSKLRVRRSLLTKDPTFLNGLRLETGTV